MSRESNLLWAVVAFAASTLSSATAVAATSLEDVLELIAAHRMQEACPKLAPFVERNQLVAIADATCKFARAPRKGYERIDAALARDRSAGAYAAVIRLLETMDASRAVRNHYRVEAQSFVLSKLKEGDRSLDTLAVYAELNLADGDAHFERAVKLLLEHHPKEYESHAMAAIAAAYREDWEEAESRVAKARALGLPDHMADSLLSAGIESRATAYRFAWYFAYVVVGWLCGLLIMFATGEVLSRLTLARIRKGTSRDAITGADRLLRKAYAAVLWLAGVFYYLSLPIIVVLSLGIAGGVVYATVTANRWSEGTLGASAILVGGTLIAALTAVRAAFAKLPDADPEGEPLDETTAGPLWKLVRDIAESLGTRPVQEIWLTPGADLAVLERGPLKARLQGDGRRTLLVGRALLPKLSNVAFRSILSHEYGHFIHRDTAGGHLALRVNLALDSFSRLLVHQGNAQFWNISYQFLRLYTYLFHRIAFGASRLQEIHADRVAVRKYGPGAFIEGLTHAVRADVEFQEALADAASSLGDGQELRRDFYETAPDYPPSTCQNIEDQSQLALRRTSSPMDSHPSPSVRFELARKLEAPQVETIEGEALSLVTDLEGLDDRLLERIEAGCAAWLRRERAIHIAQAEDYSAYLAMGATCASYTGRARAYLGLGEAQAALDDLDKAVELDAERVEVRELRAEALVKLGRPDEAIEELEHIPAFATERATAMARLEQAKLYANSGMHQEALVAFEQSESLWWGSPDEHLQRLQSHLAVGDHATALVDLEKVEEICPAYPKLDALRAKVNIDASAERPDANRNEAC